jgi:hypothetical protein
MSRGAIAVLVLLLGCPSSLLAQGVLQRLRYAVHDHPSSPSPPSPNPTNNSNDPAYSSIDTTNGETGEALLLGAGILAGTAIAAPFVLPMMALGDQAGSAPYFPSYPYPLGHPGYMRFDPWISDDPDAPNPEGPKPWAVRAAIEDGNDFRGLNRLEGRLFVDTATRLGFRTNWDWFAEDLGNGRTDHTVLGDAEVTIRFVQTESALMHAGVGGRVLTDRHDTRAGFNGLYGIELFPLRPWVLSATVDLGNLDEAFALRARGTLGATFRRWEVYGGYEFQRIGSVNLQGPMLGLRVWF